MKKKMLACLLASLSCVLLFTSCGGVKHATKKTDSAASAASTETRDETYAIITKQSGNAYNDKIVSGFQSEIENAGKKCIVEQPEKGTVAEQIKMIDDLVSSRVSCIAIAAVDADALKDSLKAAMDSGIDVCSFDTPTLPESRELFVNQTGTEQIALTLMDAVLDISGGSGYWAILSASSTSSNQNEWIDSMKSMMKDDKYKNLQLVEIAYGDDAYQKSYDQTKALLKKYPDLKVICSPTTVGMRAAAAAITDEKSKVKLTGLGLPSEMADYIGSDRCCPYMYLWNPISLGRVTAFASLALSAGEITGNLDDEFKAGDMGSFSVTKASDGGTEVIVGYPYKFNFDNINDWKDVY